METKSERARRNGPPTFDHLKKKQKRTKKVPIHLDDEVAAEVEQLRTEREQWKITLARSGGDRDTPFPRQDELDAALERLRASTVEMTFQSLGRRAYDELVEAHPPTDAQKEEAREQAKRDGQDPDTVYLPYDVEEFPIQLIAASCIEPQMTVPQVRELWDEWSTTDLTTLFMAALEVNTQRRVVDLGE